MESTQARPDVTHKPGAGVAALVDSYGAHARPIRAVLAALTERSWTLAELVPAVAVPRRTVEEVLAALSVDLERLAGDRFRISPAAAGEYRQRFGADQLRATAPADPLGPALTASTELIEMVRTLRAQAPAPKRALDHVAATPETAVRRALWLDAHFDIGSTVGAHLLCVGDHDLTALTACLLRPELTATVVDVDERLLAFIDEAAEERGLAIRCLAGDLRFGLPASAAGRAGLVFTDPPYTPDGVRLFLERSIEGLAGGGPVAGRILLAYGASERTPALALAVQRVLGELELVSEAIWPDFNRYEGAQAIGGASDLYQLRPTSKARRSGRRPAAPTIYTHGERSAEGRASGVTAAVAEALLAAAAGPAGLPVLKVGPAPGAFPIDRPLGALWTGGVPGPSRAGAVAVDATADPGGWLLRILLATDAQRLAVAVGNDHPDLADAAAQRALAELVAPKWSLRYRRSTPGPASALVEAVAMEGTDELARHVLDRSHGRLANVWRDGLVAHHGLTKAAAVAAIGGQAGDGSLMELPRHRLAPLLAAVRRSAPACGTS
jgi:predicted methyltransferase